MQALQTKPDDKKTVTNEVSKLVNSKSFVGRQVSVSCTDRNESSYDGILHSIEQGGIVIKYSSRGSDYLTFLPFSNVLEFSLKEPSVG